ncbi:MAG: methionine--tRNA ligase [Planctomycetota bacterium]|nr:methionine--tRNA ligase [Planctomycetota bacterium]
MSDRSPYYITTPIYYVNDRPHVGSCYTTLLADCAARFMRADGREVFFLTGTDEHGQKVEKSAAARGLSAQALADENAAHFREAFAFLGCSFDRFIRTTDADHERQVQEAVRRLVASGDVYLGTFEGWYDEGQEEYVTENQARDRGYKAFNGQPLIKAKENNFYFRLSAFQAKLEKLFEERPGFVRPEARRNEVLGRLRAGLQDVPVSRTSFTWGVPFPQDVAGSKDHVVYVWVDALFNYITALGLLEPGGGGGGAGAAARFWPAGVHAIGKEILWFHAVIWPALLMALGMPLPRCVYAHSFWIRDGKKMSKSLGNFIDLETIKAYCDAPPGGFGIDAWRWFQLTQGPIEATDADFSHGKFVEVYNADLANGIGNAASRVLNMIEKYFGGATPDPGGVTAHAGHDWPSITSSAVASVRAGMERFDLGAALSQAMDLSRRVDGYIVATEPFRAAKDPARLGEVGVVLYHCAEALRIAATLLSCAMPQKMAEVLRRFGQEPADGSGRFARPLAELTAWGGLKPGTRVTKGEGLFPRWDPAAAAPGSAGS